jgi:tungstate transport system ATP-binding protein
VNAQAMFRFTRLYKRIGGRELLSIEELVLESGRCILLRGDNGVGKTTLMKILSGLIDADTLTITHKGVPVEGRSQRSKLRSNVVYLHQQPYLFDCSVFDNVAYGLKRRQLSTGDIRGRVDAALEWGELAHLASRNGRQLSGGERQRVALVRGYVLQPNAMLLDEPTAGMDTESREQALALIGKMSRDGIGVVISSHELIADSSFADQFMQLKNGRLTRYDEDSNKLAEPR